METVYNLHRINTIWTFIFESHIIWLKLFRFYFAVGCYIWKLKVPQEVMDLSMIASNEEPVTIINLAEFSVHLSVMRFQVFRNIWQSKIGEIVEKFIKLWNKEYQIKRQLLAKKVVSLNIYSKALVGNTQRLSFPLYVWIGWIFFRELGRVLRSPTN